MDCVKDSETGNPLYKANIIIEGKEGKGTSTDKEGIFTLKNLSLT